MARTLYCHLDVARNTIFMTALHHSFNSRRLSALWHVNGSCKHSNFAEQEHQLTFLLIIKTVFLLWSNFYCLVSHSHHTKSYTCVHMWTFQDSACVTAIKHNEEKNATNTTALALGQWQHIQCNPRAKEMYVSSSTRTK